MVRVTFAVGIGSPRRARQAVESVVCTGSHRPASSGVGVSTDVTLVDLGGNASPSTTRRGQRSSLDGLTRERPRETPPQQRGAGIAGGAERQRAGWQRQ
jgi:hypothetical protein